MLRRTKGGRSEGQKGDAQKDTGPSVPLRDRGWDSGCGKCVPARHVGLGMGQIARLRGVCALHVPETWTHGAGSAFQRGMWGLGWDRWRGGAGLPYPLKILRRAQNDKRGTLRRIRGLRFRSGTGRSSAQGAGASKLRERAGQSGPKSGSFGLTKKLHGKTLLFQKLIFRAIL